MWVKYSFSFSDHVEVIRSFILMQPLNVRKGPIRAKSGFGLPAKSR